jgi:hypothetical protein
MPLQFLQRLPDSLFVRGNVKLVRTETSVGRFVMTLGRKTIHVALSAALGGILLLAAGSPVLADRDYAPACRDRLNADRAKVDRDAKRFGESSRQVQRDVDKMDADRNWCRSHHAEWDHEHFDVGIYLRK